MKHFYSTLFLTLFFGITILQSTFAQTGIIRGTAKDLETKQAVTGASVRIVGTQQGVATARDGRFEISKMEPGKYSIQISYLGYQDLVVEDVRVEADKIVNLQLDLQKSSGEALQEVVVSATRLRNTNQAVLTEIRSAKQVVSGVSQQQIKMSQDRDAAQVMSRIPGLTIVDNRFVMVRGIPERYNQVILNNAIAPSTEIDRRTFSFDLIPSGVLERMMIYKSGSADNPGDFAGGLVKVYTTSATGENFTSFTLSSNIRSGTTFNPYVYNHSSSTDILGFDNGRKLPALFYNQLQNTSSRGERAELARTFDNDISTQSHTASPDINFGIGLGRRWEVLGGKRLSMLSNVNYSQSNQYYSRDFNTYRVAPGGGIIQHELESIDQHYEKENRIGVLTNWSLTLNPFHKVEFKNLFNQIGENSTVLRDAVNHELAASKWRNNMYDYRSRTIYSGQFEGNHRFAAGKTSLSWVLGSNVLRENQPGLRRFRRTAQAGSSEYAMQFESLFDNSRYHGKLSEIGVNNSVNIERQIGKTSDDPILVKAGYLVDYRDRDFSSGYITYNGASAPLELFTLPIDQIFAPENFAADRFSIDDKTTPKDSYTGSNLLSAAFANITYPVRNFTFVAGIRGEYNILTLKTLTDGGAPVDVNNKIFSPLPFLNVDYSLGSQQKIRASYGHSVNRPEFREVAPFLFYDFELEAIRIGDPDLKTANISNFDLRYEWYPRAGETISVGTFYKKFTNPIEVAVQEQYPTPYTYTNALSAYSYGVELEVRKSLKDLTSSVFVDHLSVNFNASWIKSEVDYGSTVSTVAQDAQRPLQGQSPYIANAILNYQDDKGWLVSAAYNTVGPRIFAVGNALYPSIYELPRHALDLTISKTITPSLTLKVGAQDLLNASYKFYQDSNRDGKIKEDEDSLVFRYQRGTLFTTALTYTIK